MADVHKDRIIYIENPNPVVPEAKSNKGKRPGRLKAQKQGVRVDRRVEQQPDNARKRVKVRKTTKGRLIVDIPDREVRLRDGEEAEAKKRHSVVRREADSPKKIKYSLSNAAGNTSTGRPAYMQAQRYRVERPFQDAKNECGTGDHQARGRPARHHHMTMVMMAMLFMVEQRLHRQVGVPLLSCADITALLKPLPPRQDAGEAEIIRQLRERHRKRQASIDSAYEK